jgi:uncharacterized phiE125 gp8 family phage protein
MWSPAVVTVAPTVEPVTLAQASAHVRSPDTDDDMITRLITVARMHVENRAGIRLPTQTLAIKCETFDDLAKLPTAPIQSITSVVYVDTDGASQTLAGSVYEARLEGLEPQIVLKFNESWPSIQDRSRITVTAVAGYTTIPAELAHAVLMILGALYMDRESTGEASASAVDISALIENHRVFL